MKIKIDPADAMMSKYVRLRDKKCVRCQSPVTINEAGMPVSQTNSHYFGRAREGTRFEPDNCDTLCLVSHQQWGSADKEGYRNFKIKQLGEERFTTLTIQANTYAKKDRKMALLIAKELLKSVT